MNIAGTSPNPPPENTERLAPTGFESVFAMTIPWAPHAGKVSSMLTFFHNFRTAHLLEWIGALLVMDHCRNYSDYRCCQ